MKKKLERIEVSIKGHTYEIDLGSKIVWEYVYSEGGDGGDIEGWDSVGRVLTGKERKEAL